MPCIASLRASLRLRQLRPEPRLPRAQHSQERMRGGEVEPWVAALELLQQRLLLRIFVDERPPIHPSILLEHVDHTPIR
jgi:hypothetical protein